MKTLDKFTQWVYNTKQMGHKNYYFRNYGTPEVPVWKLAPADLPLEPGDRKVTKEVPQKGLLGFLKSLFSLPKVAIVR